MASNNRILRHIFFYLLLTGVGMLALGIFLPYLITISVAIAFAVVCQPLYRALLRITRNHERLAAACTILIVGILVLAPMTLLGLQVVQEASLLYEKLSDQDVISGDMLGNLETTIETYVQRYIPSFDLDLETLSRQSLAWFSTHIGAIFTNTLNLFLQIFLGIIALYYLLKDGDRFVEEIISLSPLKDRHDRKIFDRLILAINSTIKGSLFIAVIQGLISGIGFAIFGVPSATLWGGIAAIGALVPGIGTASVIAPVVIYLLTTAGVGPAIGLAIWGVVAVGLVDNFLGPVLVGRGVSIHPMFILFAVIGGIQLFGPLGFILGPLVLSLLFALLDIYKLMNTEEKIAA